MSLVNRLPTPIVKAAGAARDLKWKFQRNPETFGAGILLYDQNLDQVALQMRSYSNQVWTVSAGGGLSKLAQKKLRGNSDTVDLRTIDEFEQLAGGDFVITADRELYEETGINAQDMRRLGHLIISQDVSGLTNDTFAVFGALVDSRDISSRFVLSSEVEEIRFFPVDGLPVNLHHPVRPAVEAIKDIDLTTLK